MSLLTYENTFSGLKAQNIPLVPNFFGTAGSDEAWMSIGLILTAGVGQGVPCGSAARGL